MYESKRKKIFTLTYYIFCISPPPLILQITILPFILANHDLTQWPKHQRFVELDFPTIGRAIYIRFNKDSVEAFVTYEVDQILHKCCMDI